MFKKRFLLISFVVILILFAVLVFLFRFRGSPINIHTNSAKETLMKLYEEYKDGQIDQCFHNDQTVFVASINAYDAAGSIYNLKGENIATCNYAWGIPDKLCEELEKCERIYVAENNIWGYPPVNKYNLR